jgi:hypothetical protein
LRFWTRGRKWLFVVSIMVIHNREGETKSCCVLRWGYWIITSIFLVWSFSFCIGWMIGGVPNFHMLCSVVFRPSWIGWSDLIKKYMLWY